MLLNSSSILISSMNYDASPLELWIVSDVVPFGELAACFGFPEETAWVTIEGCDAPPAKLDGDNSTYAFRPAPHLEVVHFKFASPGPSRAHWNIQHLFARRNLFLETFAGYERGNTIPRSQFGQPDALLSSRSHSDPYLPASSKGLVSLQRRRTDASKSGISSHRGAQVCWKETITTKLPAQFPTLPHSCLSGSILVH